VRSQQAEGMIAVLTGDLLNPFFPEVIRGIQEEADKLEMILALYTLTGHPLRQERLMQRLSRRALAGVIIMGTSPLPGMLAWQQELGIPIVVLNRRIEQPGIHSIIVNFENAVYRAAQHLLALGHTRIGYLEAHSTSQIGVARKRGLETALSEAGLSLRPELCSLLPMGSEANGGFQAMGALMDKPTHERPTGVIAFNDVVALGALHAAQVRGLRVPRDVSVIGMDDIFVAAHTHPPLTTISQPKYDMGVMAVQAVSQMQGSNGNTTGGCTILESPLAVRDSTGPAPGLADRTVRGTIPELA
jgi:LacI family transcriptional regulator